MQLTLVQPFAFQQNHQHQCTVKFQALIYRPADYEGHVMALVAAKRNIMTMIVVFQVLGCGSAKHQGHVKATMAGDRQLENETLRFRPLLVGLLTMKVM